MSPASETPPCPDPGAHTAMVGSETPSLAALLGARAAGVDGLLLAAGTGPTEVPFPTLSAPMAWLMSALYSHVG